MVYFSYKYYLEVEIKTILILLLCSYSYGLQLHVPEDYQSIQLAIDSSSAGDEILVSSGIYNERIDYKGKNISIIGNDRDSVFLDGTGISNFDLVTIDHGEDMELTLLKNITIQGQSSMVQGRSALMIGEYSGITLDSIQIINNYNPGNAAAIFIDNSNVTILNSIISDNVSGSSGGAIYLENSNINILNCQIFNNNSLQSGGAIRSFESKLIITGSIFNNNSTDYSGGAIYANNSEIISKYTLFYSNESGNKGGAIYLKNSSSLIMDKSTVSDNQSNNSSSGFYSKNSNVTISNSIVWPDIVLIEAEESTNINYSCLSGFVGNGNINLNPLFNNLDNQDYSLQLSSPAIDSGNPESDCDSDGTILDMGAFSYDQIIGCMNFDACNYDYNATVSSEACMFEDCLGICGGSSIIDDCGICDGQNLPNTGICDCNSIPNGSNILDNCGICDNDLTNNDTTCDQDCNGTWGGSASIDNCGICDTNDSNDCYDYSISLHKGANLISLVDLPIDASINNIFVNAGEAITGIITEGGASSQISLGLWAGSLSQISNERGYWVIVSIDTNLEISSALPNTLQIVYDLHPGANLISFSGNESLTIENIFPIEIEPYILGVITEGGASSQITPNQWVGSLKSLVNGKGYWIITSMNISFSFNVD